MLKQTLVQEEMVGNQSALSAPLLLLFHASLYMFKHVCTAIDSTKLLFLFLCFPNVSFW